MKNYLYVNNSKIKNKNDVWKYCLEYWNSEDCDRAITNCIRSV